jgi:hypothetical protein
MIQNMRQFLIENDAGIGIYLLFLGCLDPGGVK